MLTENSRYLLAEIERLRLVLRRRVLWLRRHWQRDVKPDSLGWAITDDEADMLLAGNDGQEEARFYASDPEALSIGRQLADWREEPGAEKPLDALALCFGLNRFERDVVLLCLAPEIDPSLERIYAYLQDDATRKYATPQLALAVFAGSQFAGAERASLLPQSPLRRWHLITLGSASNAGWICSPMRLADRVADYLFGIRHLDERCRRLLRVPVAAPIAACQYDLASRLAEWLRSGERRAKLVNLVGRPDSGRLALAQAACKASGGLRVLVPHALAAVGGERVELLALLEREAVLTDAAFYLDLDELRHEESAMVLKDLERFDAPLMIASRERLSFDREMLAVAVKRPGTESQVGLWKQMLGPAAGALNGAIDSVVEQFDMGPGGITRASALARNHAALRSPGEEPNLEDLWHACQQQTASQLEQWARKVESSYDWDDIVVPREVLRQLREITAQVAHRYAVYHRWGFGHKLQRGRGISALFSGASGVGKTMAAEIMARDLRLDLYRIDLAGVVSKYIGETEKNLRGIFDAAERSGAILFFDEADALFGKRSEVKDSHDRFANIEINYLLQRMEDYRGLAILATNMKSALDNAFLRRLRFIVDFTFPDVIQRCEIWRKVFPPEAATLGLDYGLLARLDIAGGNIRNIAVNAAFLAAAERQPIGMDQVMRAARREYAKIDRLVMDAEFGRFARMESLV